MAARRGKSQARRNGSNGLPGWAWLVIGVLITLAIVLAAPRLLKSEGGTDGFFRPKPNPDAQPAATNEDGEAIAPDTAIDAAKPEADKPKQTQYDFYTLLPGEGVQMSDAELAASAKAEAEAQAKAVQQPDTTTTTTTADGSLPAPIAETPAATSTTSPTTEVATNASITPATGSDDTRYLLQAGAFGASGDAETVKAKIAMLGLNARVESAQIGGKTVYRVRMGPYGSASELADAKARLSGGGLPAMAVKTN
ncbi:SPOR domain-containing protein [Thermomonas carbonis]|uniref:SPOR domain-containing protein n=1 Tax=Thermomonas carbonis TaxID=1463158 RepID=A0A7G9SSE7_9GAMM|nr:SPOR domain-containing protein [Thermomonas carbonis]QNN70772.1 SPOR domain-containing protein [Thermomonas carbonis]GHC02274.1 sporulation protein [Thermomonas carbonis]